MKDYDSSLESSGKGHDADKQHGVTTDSRNEGWGHRSEMEAIDHEKRQSISQRVNERRTGEEADPNKKDHGEAGKYASNENDDELVDEGKTKAQRYRDRYG